MEIPAKADWDDQAYRQWIRWNYNRRLEIWDLNNRISKSTGGKECIWAGMNSGSVSSQSRSFRDYKEICARAEIIMLDSQARNDAEGFQQNGISGKMIHSCWDGKNLFRKVWQCTRQDDLHSVYHPNLQMKQGCGWPKE